MNYKKKYLKYKLKYLKLKKLSGGTDELTEEQILDCARESDRDHAEQSLIYDIEDSIDEINTFIENKENLSDYEIKRTIIDHITKLEDFPIPKKYGDKLGSVIRQIHGETEADGLMSKLTIKEEKQDEQTLPFTRPRSPTLDRMTSTVRDNSENEPTCANEPTCENVCNIM